MWRHADFKNSKFIFIPQKKLRRLRFLLSTPKRVHFFPLRAVNVERKQGTPLSLHFCSPHNSGFTIFQSITFSIHLDAHVDLRVRDDKSPVRNIVINRIRTLDPQLRSFTPYQLTYMYMYITPVRCLGTFTSNFFVIHVNCKQLTRATCVLLHLCTKHKSI